MLQTTEMHTNEEEFLEAELRQKEIALRAYQLYEMRGYLDGFDLEDWLKAEQEITGQSEIQNSLGQAAAG